MYMVSTLMVQKQVIQNNNPLYHSSIPNFIRNKEFLTLKICLLF